MAIELTPEEANKPLADDEEWLTITTRVRVKKGSTTPANAQEIARSLRLELADKNVGTVVGHRIERAHGQVYEVELLGRKALKALPEVDRGWWEDVCPGQTLRLRQAEPADLARCLLTNGASTNPDDYYCELFSGGALVNKKAVKSFTLSTH